MDDKERYTEICEPRFDTIETNAEKRFERMMNSVEGILSILRGNGTPGLINRINAVEMKVKAEAEARKGFYSFLSKNWLAIIMALFMLFTLLSDNKITPEELKELAAQVKALTP